MPDKFPVLIPYSIKDTDHGCPRYVDFKLLNEHQAIINHGVTLKRLASRGGMSPCEIVANVEGLSYHSVMRLDLTKSIRYINKNNLGVA